MDNANCFYVYYYNGTTDLFVFNFLIIEDS